MDSNTTVINAFPGYEFKFIDGEPCNMYRGINVGFGGYVFAKPGMYGRTIVLDVSGMHPASIRAMNCFGDKTQRFGELVDLRTAIKHKDYDTAKKMLDGKVAKYLTDEKMAKGLSSALKIAVNSCYGLTSANFANPMRDPRNTNNIVALRGALFMVTLKDEIEKMGYIPISIKTDSIKIVNPDDEIISFVKDFGRKYGYEFEVENIFERICLVNQSTFVAKCAEDDPDPDLQGKWYAKAEQFKVPYVFKTLFTHEKIGFEDLCETKTVSKGLIYLDMNEELPEDEHNYIFVGKVGQFCPIKKRKGGGILYRKADDGKYYAISGTKGYRWLESELVRNSHKEKDIDETYYKALVADAIAAIEKYGNFDAFVADGPYMDGILNIPPGTDEEVPFE